MHVRALHALTHPYTYIYILFTLHFPHEEHHVSACVYEQNKCGVENENEDLVTGRCLHTLGVLPHNSIDVHGRAAFHPETPEKHIARPEVQPWLKEYDRFPGAVVSQ